MKQSIILWISAIVITFLTGYFESVTNPAYPVSGTIGVNGYKVSYKFDKVHHGESAYHFFIRSDIKDLHGQLFWHTENQSAWIIEDLQWKNDKLYADIPNQKPGTVVKYRAKVEYEEKEYLIPGGEIVSMKFLGDVPAAIWGVIYFSLYGGLLLSIRTGLDYFNENDKIRKLALFMVFFFFAYLVTFPLKTTYELGVINNRVPGFLELFSWQPVLLFLNAVFIMIGLFNFKEKKITALIGAVIMIFIFLFIRS